MGSNFVLRSLILKKIINRCPIPISRNANEYVQNQIYGDMTIDFWWATVAILARFSSLYTRHATAGHMLLLLYECIEPLLALLHILSLYVLLLFVLHMFTVYVLWEQ